MMLDEYRKNLYDLDDAIAVAEQFIQDFGVPVCDYKLAISAERTFKENVIN